RSPARRGGRPSFGMLCVTAWRPQWRTAASVAPYDPFVDPWQLAGQIGHALDDAVPIRVAHFAQIVVAGEVDGDAERADAGGLGLAQRDGGVAQPVDVAGAVLAVVEVLREPVAQQDEMPRASAHPAHRMDRVADRGAHARAAPR